MAVKHSRTLVCAVALLVATSGSAWALEGAGTSAPTNYDDAQFSRKAAAAGIAEIQLGELGLRKSSDDNVKNLARRVIEDHRKADAQLADLGTRKHLDLPSEPDAAAAKAQAKLGKKSGHAFDQAWSKLMIKDHQDAVKLFSTESSKGDDAELRKFAADTLPTLQAHLKSAQQIAAVPSARDKAMDATMKTMSAGNLGPPPGSTATATTPPTSMSTPSHTTRPATATSSLASPATPPIERH